ncbi:MAG: DUF3626 domain-containing protein [Pseudohongiella sp.]|nr:DUF3626 domain-containing protein [Pseudohongiella sp.]MDP2126655.1 DUF3626 domain-containing protein [Pseudohongiella sp.]
MKNTLSPIQQKALERFRCHGELCPDASALEVTVNFHPDRLTRDGQPVLSRIASDGYLRSQFETGTGNGGVSAFAGGDRWNWESAAFNGLYDDAPASERPKYGALNHRRHGAGGSPRFGSSFFTLKSHVLDRTTFCYPESWLGPREYGYAGAIQHLIDLADADEPDALDHYIEAHIHGSIAIASDVDKLVLDPCYKGTEVEKAAALLGCTVEWHKGFSIRVSALNHYANYRGQQYIALAHDIAENGIITPLMIGAAVNQQLHDAQDLKKVWHYLAKFGNLNLAHAE